MSSSGYVKNANVFVFESLITEEAFLSAKNERETDLFGLQELQGYRWRRLYAN
jgi:hypothetical protein